MPPDHDKAIENCDCCSDAMEYVIKQECFANKVFCCALMAAEAVTVIAARFFSMVTRNFKYE